MPKLKTLNNEKLDKIIGGTSSITGSIINAFTNIIKLLITAGEEVGSSLRRITEGKICPLE